MKKTEIISENTDYTAINIGSLEEIKQHSLIHPKTLKKVDGKVFLNAPTHATGTEISFTTLPPHSELGYFHHHVKIEETYIILSGSGFYQVNDDCFPIKQGSVIRVAPDGVRSLCNTSDKDMVYICVQSKKDTLEEHTTNDGSRLPYETKWPKIG